MRKLADLVWATVVVVLGASSLVGLALAVACMAG